MKRDSLPHTALLRRYGRLKDRLARMGWFCHGSVVEAPRPGGGKRPYYRWTRKEARKTVTVALSASQAKVWRQAIARHRQLQNILRQMRQIGAQVLLQTTAGVSRRNRRKSS